MRLALAAPVGALIIAALITSIILIVTGHNPLETFGALVDAFSRPRTVVNTINVGATYYLAAVAVAIGFKMNLFNIGVDGQYRLAAFMAAAVGGAAFMTSLPGPLRIVVTIAVAMLVGAAWAGVAALLKATRGVSEVISTIMLNAIATYIIAFLLKPARLGVAEGNNISTAKIDRGRVRADHSARPAGRTAAVFAGLPGRDRRGDLRIGAVPHGVRLLAAGDRAE